MRGTRLPPPRSRAGGRFIPAYAGNAAMSKSASEHSPVHPRVCGERVSGFKQFMILSGSSPRMRGTLKIHIVVPAVDRFIPAYAGNAAGAAAC